jgi:hypothetical protein
MTSRAIAGPAAAVGVRRHAIVLPIDMNQENCFKSAYPACEYFGLRRDLVAGST